MKLRARLTMSALHALRTRLPALEAAARARLLARLQATAGRARPPVASGPAAPPPGASDPSPAAPNVT